MRARPINLFAFTAIILLSGCNYGLVGKNFFIRNYEDQAVNIHYKYYDYDNLGDSPGFAFIPKPEILMADTILKDKLLNQFLNKSAHYFDTIDVKILDSLNYEFILPAKSTVNIARVYYGDNIEYVILNRLDTIKFKHEYPYVENEALFDQDIVGYHYQSLSYSYYVINLRLKEIIESFEVDQ